MLESIGVVAQYDSSMEKEDSQRLVPLLGLNGKTIFSGFTVVEEILLLKSFFIEQHRMSPQSAPSLFAGMDFITEAHLKKWALLFLRNPGIFT